VGRRLRGASGLVLLEQPEIGGSPRQSILGIEPSQVLGGNLATSEEIEARLEAHQGWPGGLLGWIGFDGQFSLGLYEALLVFDHEKMIWEAEGEFPFELLDQAALRPPGGLLDEPAADDPAELFLRAVEAIRAYIEAGDVYQANLARRFSAQCIEEGDAYAFYEALAAVSPAPWSAFLDLGGRQIASSSPECFLALDGSEIQSRPIKGTRPRLPGDSKADAELAMELSASPKERAELLMITDLMRNDLGQVCKPGSVETPELRALESFAQVHHLVSTVRGTLRTEVTHLEALRSCFPAGSISGAPKKRALEIIHQLESVPRGVYTGAIGHFGFRGRSRWNVAIRTAVMEGAHFHFHSGAGIVADSDPALELEETEHKARGILEASRRWSAQRASSGE